MYTKNAKKKIENMPLQERIAYGYKKVIMLMLISGLLSIIAIGVLLADLLNYVQKINASDIAVKMCRVNVNAAARNIREMALDDDEASYETTPVSFIIFSWASTSASSFVIVFS